MAPDGSVYVSEAFGTRVRRFDAAGLQLNVWGGPGAGAGQFSSYGDGGPKGVAVAPDGTVLVADPGNGRIQRFGPTGAFRDEWPYNAEASREVVLGDTLAVGPDESSYVGQCATWYCGITRLSADGEIQARWGSRGREDGQLMGVGGFAFGPDGTVYIADSDNHRMQHFTADGRFLAKWGATDASYPGPDELRVPTCLAMAPDGDHLFVCHLGGSTIRTYATDGELVGEWDVWSEVGATDTAVELRARPDGDVTLIVQRVYRGAADRSPDRAVWILKQYTPRGDLVAEWPLLRPDPDSYVRGVAFGPDGTAYLSDTFYGASRRDHRVLHFSAAGQLVGRTGGWGHDTGQFASPPDDIAIGPSGALYVLDQRRIPSDGDRGKGIQVFGPEYPTAWRAQYSSNRWLAEWPITVQRHDQIDLDWGSDAPATGLPADGFSVRFERPVPHTTGLYRFEVQAEGGVRLWAGRRLVVDDWSGRQSVHAATLLLAADDDRFRLEYNDPGGAASVRLSWRRAGEPWHLFLPSASQPE